MTVCCPDVDDLDSAELTSPLDDQGSAERDSAEWTPPLDDRGSADRDSAERTSLYDEASASEPRRRSVVCLNCGHIDAQREASDGTWLRAFCGRCGAGHSLYLRLTSVAGWKTGAYVGDGREPDEFKGSSYSHYAGGFDPRRRVDGGDSAE